MHLVLHEHGRRTAMLHRVLVRFDVSRVVDPGCQRKAIAGAQNEPVVLSATAAEFEFTNIVLATVFTKHSITNASQVAPGN